MALTEITVTYGMARRMGTVASAATAEPIRGALTHEHTNAIHAVARRLVTDGDAAGIVSVFGAAAPDETLATLELDDDVFREYLAALDTIATTTATPHHREACNSVFTHFVGAVDADAKGLHFQRYQTLQPKSKSRVFG